MSEWQPVATVGGMQVTATPREECLHLTGWFVVVPFWIFRKRVFVCSDCGEVLPVLPKKPYCPVCRAYRPSLPEPAQGNCAYCYNHLLKEPPARENDARPFRL